jgi:hypothetical protein
VSFKVFYREKECDPNGGKAKEEGLQEPAPDRP